MADKIDKFNIADLMTFDTNGVSFNEEALQNYMKDLLSFESLKDVPGMTEEIAESIQNIVLAEAEATEQTNRFENALNALSKGKDLLSNIRSGSDDIVGMIQAAAEMASESGQKLSDFFNSSGFYDAHAYFTGNMSMWNESAIYNYVDKYIDGLEGINGLAPDTVRYIKRIMRMQIQEIGIDDRLNKVLSGTKTVMENIVSGNTNKQITREQLQSLLEVSK